MNKTDIPWADYSWNPIVGCSPASEGCANCYAAAISRRFHLPWGSAHFIQDRLGQPARKKKPGRVFVCSMADLGHETVAPDWRDMVLDEMRSAPWHTYIVLTKRPGAWMRPFHELGCWCGVTAENQDGYEERWLQMTAHCYGRYGGARFLSVEPMLGPVSLRGDWVIPDWVIAGPETGSKARPCSNSWVNELSDESECFFDKRESWRRREWPGL